MAISGRVSRFLAVPFALGAAVVTMGQAPPGTPPAAAPAAATATPPLAKNSSANPQLERGRYLVAIMGCNDCHTPLKMGAHGPEPDMSKMLMGHPSSIKLAPAAAPSGGWLWAGSATNTAFSGPWGISYAANLTPDSESGLGSAWTADRFVQAIRTGKHLGVGRPINPPMPWPSFKNATANDLRAIYVYLKSIKPIRNFVPDYQPPPGAPPVPAH